MAARIAGLLVTCYLLLITLASPAFAQTIPSYIPPTSPVYTDLLVHNLFHTFSCLAIGQSVIGQPCLSYQLQKNAQGTIKSVPVLSQVNLGGGALGGVTSFIGLLYAHPPVRTADYLASLGQNLGIVKEAHAQVVGSGAQVLSPIIKLWQVSRNISYVVMIIIFVIIGIMIMFRQRINPQTVITAQAALPGLVIGLIMITFSYFLSALLSDTAFIGTNVVGYYFSAVRGDPIPQDLLKDLDKYNVIKIVSHYLGIINPFNATPAIESVWNDMDIGVRNTLQAIGSLVAAQFVLPFGSLGGGKWQLIAIGASTAITQMSPPGTVAFVITLMAMVILTYAMLRLLLRLIKAYLSLVFLTITAPFQFLAAALPGRQGIATGWILNMLSNALAFPAVLAVLYFVAFILNNPFGPLKVSNSGAPLGNGLIQTVSAATPTIIGTDTFPLFSGMDLDFVRALIAFGALVAMPAIPDVIARTIGRIGVAGQLLGEEAGKGMAGGRGYYGQATTAPGGLAQSAGRLTDTKGKKFIPATIDPNTGKTIEGHWVESTKAYEGMTQGTIARIKGSTGWQQFSSRAGRAWGGVRNAFRR